MGCRLKKALRSWHRFSALVQLVRNLKDRIDDRRYSGLFETYHIGGEYRRIYFYHVRKTGGTSLNHMFLSLGGEKGNTVYERLNRSLTRRVVSGNKVFVGARRSLIEEGNYFYAYSHLPSHKVQLPKNTFTVTVLRDPVKRVVSHYRMLLTYKERNIYHPCMEVEGEWIEDGFEGFISRIPQQHLFRQIYMFSETLDVDEAFENIMSCSHYFFTSSFVRGVQVLSRKVGFDLEPVHIRTSSAAPAIEPPLLSRLRTRLEPEYQLYGRLKRFAEGL